MIAAIRGIDSGQGLDLFVLEKGPVHPTVEMIPGQDLIDLTPAQIGLEFKSAGISRPLPALEIELLRPAVETGAVFPGLFQEMGQAAVAREKTPSKKDCSGSCHLILKP